MALSLIVERRWRLPIVRSFKHVTRRLPDDVVPRREQGASEEEKTVPGTRMAIGGGREDEYRNAIGDKGGGENGSGNGDDSRDEVGREKYPANLLGDNRGGGSEDARGGPTPATTLARPDASARPSHHAEDQSPGMEGEGQDQEEARDKIGEGAER